MEDLKIVSMEELKPSQQSAVNRIRLFFNKHALVKIITESRLETFDGSKGVFYHIKTAGNVFTESGGYFYIGPRGAITVYSVYRLGLKKDRRKTGAFYANMLKAKNKVS